MTVGGSTLAERLRGGGVPNVQLIAGDGRTVRLADLVTGLAILYLYPGGEEHPVEKPRRRSRRFAAPEPAPERIAPSSCAVQRRGFRELALDFASFGAKIFGVSCEPHTVQREVTLNEQLPFTLLSDPQLLVADALRLPTLDDRGTRRYRRATLAIGADGLIETVFYPVSPKRGPRQTLAWVQRAWND